MELVPPALRELFIDAIATTSDMYLRARFTAAGIPTDEVLAPSPSPKGGYMETRPVRHRVERYFAQINWTDRRSVARLLPLVERALAALQWHPSGTRAAVECELTSLGLEFRDGRIRRTVTAKLCQKS